jgi:hypothetical protein
MIQYLLSFVPHLVVSAIHTEDILIGHHTAVLKRMKEKTRKPKRRKIWQGEKRKEKKTSTENVRIKYE